VIRNSRKEKKYLWVALLVLMNVLWAGSYSVMKLGLSNLSAVTIVFSRFFISFVFLLPFVIVTWRRINLSKKNILFVLAAGFLIGISHWLELAGVNDSHATDASLLYVFEPIGGIFAVSIFLKEKLRVSSIVALLIALFGFASLANFNLSLFISKNSFAFGNLLIVIAMVGLVLVSMVLKYSSEVASPIHVMFAATAVASLVLVFPVYPHFRELADINSSGVFSILYLAIGCTMFGYIAWIASMKRLPLNVMYFTIFIQPIAGPFIAFVILGERISINQLIGGGILILSMMIAVFGYLKGNQIEKICVDL